ncbi:MAG: 3-isopropylmalate dehydratase small subunit [Euryarchaeota archaeon]|nr:3-isopropylmalate dehydratase small subunit [Euryarchaeota archaeon]
MNKYIKGRVWRFPENVDTDQIIPAKYLVTGDKQELAKHAFENVRPDFAEHVREGDIIVAGKNFGSGSSREHAPRALIGAGIACVVAPSFARIFYRNSINIGLPLVECEIDAADGDLLAVDFENGTIVNMNTRSEYGFNRLPDFLMDLLDFGLIENTKRKLERLKRG